MSQINRLSNGGRIDRNKVLTFSFNGQTYKGFEGDTLAAALLANGVDIIGRSFKYSRPRGIFAAGAEEPNAVLQIGATEATQIPNVRATQQALYQGLVATSTNERQQRHDGHSRQGRRQADAAGFLLQNLHVPAIVLDDLREVHPQGRRAGPLADRERSGHLRQLQPSL